MTTAPEPGHRGTWPDPESPAVTPVVTAVRADAPAGADPAVGPDLDNSSTPAVSERVRMIDGHLTTGGVTPEILHVDVPDDSSPAAAAAVAELNAEQAVSLADDPGAVDVDRFNPRDVADEESVAIGFNLAKIPGQGEDADPLQMSTADLVVVGVFDGMGGAGGTTYQTPEGAHTGAYLASRTARKAVVRRLADIVQHPWAVDAPRLAEELAASIGSALSAQLAGLNAPRSGLRSKMIRALPTTMALAVAQRQTRDSPTWTCHLFWAGDSRVYLVEPGAGAAQLTVDDLRAQGDAMANLREDSVLSNAISADTPFVINTRTVELTEPFLLVAATDGCFGYLASPMHFEHLLLAALRDSATAEDWSRRVQTAVSAATGDDAAMTAVGRGAGHESLWSVFAERTNVVDNRWVRPLDGLAADQARLQLELELLTAKHRESAAELWADYKDGYERLLTTPHPAEDEQ